MNRGFVDIHSHILPGIDDGSRSMEETKKMLTIAKAEGIRTIIATPHHHPRRGKSDVASIMSVYKEVKELASEMSVSLRLGCEIYYDRDTIKGLNNHTILPLLNTNNVLVEFSTYQTAFQIIQGLQALQIAGYQPIVAHVERYEDLYIHKGSIEQLYNMGVRLQVNANSITGESGWHIKRVSRKLLKQHFVSYIATDAHNTGERAPRLEKAAEIVSKKYGDKYMLELFRKNARRLIGQS